MVASAVNGESDAVKAESPASQYWLDPGNLRREIAASELQRNELISGLPDMIRKYEGPGRHQDMADYAPENHYFEWISLVLPRVLARNPVLSITSKRPTVSEYDAVALEAAINRWAKETKYASYLRRIGVAWSFCYGVGLTTLEPYGGDFDDPKHRPRVIYLDPEQFGMDSLARSWEEARFMFHRCAERKADLLRRAKAEDGWDVQAVEDLATSDEVEGMGRPKADVGRAEVSYWEVWVPELSDEDDETHHGKLLTLGVMSGGGMVAKQLRKPRRYYGPRWGPYTLFGAYTVPRSAWPMGPLQAHEGQNYEANLHARANSKSAARRKSLMIYDKADPEAGKAVAKAEDGSAVGITNFERARFEMFEAKGVTEDALAYEQWARERLERVSGLNDRAKGDLASAGTATADAIAAQGANVRMAGLEDTLYDGSERQISTVAWYYWHNDLIVEPVPDEAKAQFAQMTGNPAIMDMPMVMRGGGFQGSFDDLELEIKQRSMEREDEAGMQARTMQMLQVLPGLGAAVVQYPFLPWKSILGKAGKVMNWPEIEAIDMDLAAQISALMLQAEQPVQAGPVKRQEGPRMSSDRGSAVGGPARLQKPSEMGKGGGGLPGYQTGNKAAAKARSA
jgi:hypothetical protein